MHAMVKATKGKKMSSRRVLFNPGPTNVNEQVRHALSAAPDMNHRELEFSDMLGRVLDGMTALASRSGAFDCVPFVASGTGANEAVVGTVRGKLLTLNSGRYGHRLTEIARRLGVECRELTFDPLLGIDVDGVRAALADDPTITHVAFAHHETTTSLLVHLADLCKLCRAYGKITIVDAVSSLFGHDIDLDRDGVDFCTVSANKCLEGVPGLAFVLARRDRLAELEGRSRCYYFDLHEQWRRTATQRVPPYTMPLYQLSAVDVALERLRVEGVLQRAKRYRALKDRLREGLLRLGLSTGNIDDARTSNVLQLIARPSGVQYPALHRFLKDRGYTIYTDELTLGLGYLYFATMGDLPPKAVDGLVSAVGEYLHVCG